jgi:cation diffusion facilitator family transporter
MTDVITTGGVLLGVLLVGLTGFERLDPIIALIVAVNILFTGIRLLRHSARGLMDVSLPASDLEIIQDTLKPYKSQGMVIHALRTRESAARGYVSMHILVPGSWSVSQAHRKAEEIESEIRKKIPQVAVFTHIEPVEEPESWQDSTLDRE